MDVIVSVQATPQKSPDILRITLFSSWNTPILPSVDSRVLLSAPLPHPMLTYSPSQKCGGCASVPRRSPRAPGVWELWPGPAAQNCSWRHGSTVCHSPATAASSAPEKCPLLCQTSLQDKTESYGELHARLLCFGSKAASHSHELRSQVVCQDGFSLYHLGSRSHDFHL